MSERYIHKSYPTAYAIVMIDGEPVRLTPADPRWATHVGKTASAYSRHLAASMVETTTTWYRCPTCQHVFDVPAARPSCPKCGTRCDERHHTEPQS